MDFVNNKPVLCIGNAVVDFINRVDSFPSEDSEQLGLDYYWQRGGNATNNCTVLSKLNTPCEFMGVFTTVGPEASWLREDFQKAGITIDGCVTVPGPCPVATSIISKVSGSRTILAYPRNCPELAHDEFKERFKGDFTSYSWIHFELRNETKEVAKMMEDVIAYNKEHTEEGKTSVILSVEVENPNSPCPELAMAGADIIFISKDFAKSKGCKDITEALGNLYNHCRPGSVLVCAWGDVGAGARCKDQVFFSPARQDIQVVDTLGAGDTFTAAFISHRRKQIFGGDDKDGNFNLQTSLDFACQLAGYKCGVYGYQELENCTLVG